MSKDGPPVEELIKELTPSEAEAIRASALMPSPNHAGGKSLSKQDAARESRKALLRFFREGKAAY